jgi:hypothetical protein
VHLGLGCAVENMTLVAQAEGFTVEVRLLTDGADLEHVAHLALTTGQAQLSDLYTAIPNCHTNRSPYHLTRSVAPDAQSFDSARTSLPKYFLMAHESRMMQSSCKTLVTTILRLLPHSD